MARQISGAFVGSNGAGGFQGLPPNEVVLRVYLSQASFDFESPSNVSVAFPGCLDISGNPIQINNAQQFTTYILNHMEPASISVSGSGLGSGPFWITALITVA